MAQSWADRAEQMVFSLAEMLGLEAAAPLALWPAGVLLLSVGLGLILTLLLLGLHRPGGAREQRGKPEDIVLEPGKAGKSEEPKKRSRKKAGDKKLQRNGLAVEPQEEAKTVEVHSHDPADLKADKAKKNKKKPKAPAKEAKSAPSERKEPEEVMATPASYHPQAGAWETKVSNREKRQQRRKDKGAGDESGSPGGVEPSATEQPIITPEEPKITIPTTPTKTKNITTRTTTTTKNTTRTSTTSTPAAAVQRREEPPAVEVHAVIPQVSPGWEEVLSMNGSSWGELAPPVHPDNWNSLSAERQDLHAAWPQDMEGSWTIVDGSFTGLPAAGESQPVPDLSWACQPQVDDEWSAPNTSCADPSSDWRPPSEEWGNYEDRPAERAVSSRAPPAELQESDTEKDKEELAAPGSGKAKKKKKKKKKLEDGGTAAQVEGEGGMAKDQNTAGNILPKTVKEQESVAPSAPARAALKPTEPEMMARSSATPAQKKPEDSWESPKQVKKKKARRET